ncbi:MAG: hypothetical protein HQM09_09130 [Candidatus Riflebacteria bacterium]|nr:hypothetical protein [Candidatus Riflebacteria bacterium]
MMKILLRYWGIALLLAFVPGHGFGCVTQVFFQSYFGAVNGFPSLDITALASDKKGTMFIGTKDRGVIVIPAGARQWSAIIDESKSLGYNAIHAMLFINDGTLAIGTAGGLNYLDAQSDSLKGNFSAEDGLKDNAVLSLAKYDANSPLWAGTTLGLVNKDDGCKRYTVTEGLLSDHVQSLAMDGEGNLWIGTSKGLVCMTGTSIHPVDLSNGAKGVDQWVNAVVAMPASSKIYRDKILKTYDMLIDGVSKRPPCIVRIPVKTKPIPGAKAPEPQKVEEPTTPPGRWANHEPQRGGAPAEPVEVLEWKEVDLNAELKESLLAEKEKVLDDKLIPSALAATNSGFYAIRRDGDSFDVTQLAQGWFTAIAVDACRKVFFADNGQNVRSLGPDLRPIPEFDVGTMIEDYLLNLVRTDTAGNASGALAIPLIPEQLQTLKNMGEEQLKEWIKTKIRSKNISCMTFDPSGNLWIGLQEGGLFQINPAIVNEDAVTHAIINQEKAHSNAPGTESEQASKTFVLTLTTPKVTYPPLEPIIDGLKEIERKLERAPEKGFWVGRWSQLEDEDCFKTALFVGEFSEMQCIRQLARFLPMDPFVLIPLVDPPKPGEAKNKKASDSSRIHGQ